GGTAGQPARRAHIRWRSIVGIDATHAVEELVANRFAGDRGAGGENFLHSAGVSSGGLLRGGPIRTATPRPSGGNIVHVLDDGRQSGERAGFRADNRRTEIMRNKERVFHAACFLYQSRMRTPSHAATPGLLNSSSKARRTWAIRCGIPDR